jgi:hypothetical protein
MRFTVRALAVLASLLTVPAAAMGVDSGWGAPSNAPSNVASSPFGLLGLADLDTHHKHEGESV